MKEEHLKQTDIIKIDNTNVKVIRTSLIEKLCLFGRKIFMVAMLIGVSLLQQNCGTKTTPTPAPVVTVPPSIAAKKVINIINPRTELTIATSGGNGIDPIANTLISLIINDKLIIDRSTAYNPELTVKQNDFFTKFTFKSITKEDLTFLNTSVDTVYIEFSNKNDKFKGYDFTTKTMVDVYQYTLKWSPGASVFIKEDSPYFIENFKNIRVDTRINLILPAF